MKFNFTPRFTVWKSPLGPMTLAAHGDALVGVWFNGQQHMPDTSKWADDSSNTVLQATQSQLSRYFDTGRSDFNVKINLDSGTAFQRAVWSNLRSIAPGQTVSYGGIALALASPKAVRAVGAAVGRNPISIIVPCHRVLGAGGALTGYAGGLDRKTHLLQLEGAL